MQYVSSTPATRLDVINLQEKLDQQLQQRQVRIVLNSMAVLASGVYNILLHNTAAAL